jgi:ADP-ribose pyrophosphatase
VPKKKMADNTEKTLKRRYVFKGRLVKVRVDTIETPDGRRADREIVEHPDAVVMVALDKDDNILLVDQYRTPVGKRLLELPAGVIEKGEDAETTVIREMQEETGYKPRKVGFLGGFHTAPGFSNEYLHLYLAMNLKLSPLTAEDSAGIKLIRVPLKEITGLVTSGRIQDAKTIAGLMLFLEYCKNH